MNLTPPVCVAALALCAFSAPAFAQNALALNGAPTSGRVRVTAALRPDPTRINAPAGGTIAHPSCTGFTSERPAVMLTVVPASQFVRIAPAQLTTPLYALGPDGRWRCTVDSTGIRSALEGPLTTGVWRVWLGSIASGAPARTSLTVSVRQPPQDPATNPDAGVSPNPLALGVSLVNQAINAVQGNNTPDAQAPRAPQGEGNPFQVPLQEILRAGMDPQHLPGPLDAILRNNQSPWANSTSPQLGQLGQLAQAGLAAQQLQSVATSLMGNGAPAGSVLSPTQLTQVTELARHGASSPELQRVVTQMLQSAAQPH